MTNSILPVPNPLLDFSDMPRFGDISPEHVAPAIEQLISEGRAAIARCTAPDVPVSWANLVEPLEMATERVARAWRIVSHFNAVADTPEMRAAIHGSRPLITDFSTELGQHLALFAKYQQLRSAADYAGYSPARKRVVENAVRDFHLRGIDLTDEKKQRYAKIQEALGALAVRFSENVLDAIRNFVLLVDDEAELAGLPADAIQSARAAAQGDGKAGFKISLHYSSVFPILQFAEVRALRQAMYYANLTKASEFGGNPEWDNTDNIVEILRLREEESALLGYPSYAQMALVPRMAETPGQVIAFLEEIARRSRRSAQRDLAELSLFAKEELGLEELEAWDVPYASEKLREQRYAFSEHEVTAYFPESKVVNGLFRLVESMFSVQIKADTAPTWHADVKVFRIERNGILLGHFYLDLYSRAGKRGGAWMTDLRARRSTPDGMQTPLAIVTCNFKEPVNVNGQPGSSRLTHNNVITLFHEFGHALHHLLTTVDELGVSGVAGVELDAAELPSQFMENFCWEWDVLQQMTAHVDTNAPLPRALFDKMVAAKNFQSGLQTLRQVEFALVDMRLHGDFDPKGALSVQKLIDGIRADIAVLVPPAFSRFQNSFEHIFSGGYAAGYYSYKWAEVLSADAYACFEECRASGDDARVAEAGRQFLREILEVGGSRPALESFKAFRGREPKVDALLRHTGCDV